MPALLTSRSIRPALPSTSSTSFATDTSSVTSQVSMVMPSALSAAARRLVPSTRYPALCRALAVACPMPEDAPVTRATLELVLFMEITSVFMLIGYSPHPVGVSAGPGDAWVPRHGVTVSRQATRRSGVPVRPKEPDVSSLDGRPIPRKYRAQQPARPE